MANDYSNMLKQIDKQLKKYGNVQSLMQYINVNNLYKEHLWQDSNKATGVDKISKDKYAINIKDNLNNLIINMKRKKYFPKEVRRVMIPKPNGKQRPLGIPSYEDKLVQASMARILNEILERYFKDFSYGFRPNKDCHQAIKRIDEIIMKQKINYIVEADIKGFFDHVDHELLIRMLERVIKDRDFILLVKRFLKAGYMYKEKHFKTEEGTPQGGIISPILANLYLHVVLDNWFENEFKGLCKGDAYIVRYADDFTCMFQYEDDARMFYQMLIKRFAQFKLEIEPEKTRIFPFGRNSKDNITFDFLGFTISNGTTRNKYYKIDYTTSKKKSKIIHNKLKDFVKESRDTKPKDLIKQINKKLIGIYNYYGISGNYLWMIRLHNFVKRIIRKWLSRRSQRGKLTWERLYSIIDYNPIIMPKISFKLW